MVQICVLKPRTPLNKQHDVMSVEKQLTGQTQMTWDTVDDSVVMSLYLFGRFSNLHGVSNWKSDGLD